MCNKFGISGSARFQLVGQCAAHQDNLSHKSRQHKKFEGKPSAISKLDSFSRGSSFSRASFSRGFSFSRGSSFSRGLRFWVLGLRSLFSRQNKQA